MNIMAIDTSTTVLGVGLANDEKIIGEYVTNIKKTHSTRVLPAIDYLLKDCGISLKDIDKIVVANGPGSYTGLRIGVTIGKTLAWTLNLPVAGVSSLMAIASGGHYFSGFISPVIDARRGNIFTGLYKYENDTLRPILQDRHIHAGEWANLLKTYEKPVLFIGGDAKLHEQTFKERLHEQACFAPETVNLPRPGILARIGKDIEGENVHQFAPEYLRLTEAEAKWREKTGNH